MMHSQLQEILFNTTILFFTCFTSTAYASNKTLYNIFCSLTLYVAFPEALRPRPTLRGEWSESRTECRLVRICKVNCVPRATEIRLVTTCTFLKCISQFQPCPSPRGRGGGEGIGVGHFSSLPPLSSRRSGISPPQQGI